MEPDPRLIADLRGFVAEVALTESGDGQNLLAAFGQRLRADGVPVSRLSAAWRTLDPLVYAHQITWTAALLKSGDFFHLEVGERSDGPHPLRLIVDNELALYRYDLTRNEHPYVMFDELAAEGHTEYVGGVEKFSQHRANDGALRGIFFSACADAPGGFGDGLGIYLALRRTLALGFRAIIEQRMAHAVARTYLGRLAAERVLAGAIRRGDAEVIPAAIWYSDVRSFTPMSEALPLDDTISFLNEVFEATAGAVEDCGGHVLDFIGDGVLAIFPLADDGAARALVALDGALARLDAVRAAHAADPRPVIRTTLARGLVGIALAVGDVRFGNIGTGQRLSFSVIGPTVNTVARIEGMTKVLGEPVLVTDAIAATAPDRFVSRGAHVLEGVAESRTLYALASAPRTLAVGDAPAALNAAVV